MPRYSIGKLGYAKKRQQETKRWFQHEDAHGKRKETVDFGNIDIASRPNFEG